MRNKNSSFALLPFYLERIRFSDRILPVLAIPENYDMERYLVEAISCFGDQKTWIYELNNFAIRILF